MLVSAQEPMVEIKLEDGKDGYGVVHEYIKRYWKHDNMFLDDMIVSLGTSYDGIEWSRSNEIAELDRDDLENIIFVNDWWEGEPFLRIYGITGVSKLNISGGIYEE